MRELFAKDPERGLAAEPAGVQLDYSKKRITTDLGRSQYRAFTPYRPELVNGATLRQWLTGLAKTERPVKSRARTLPSLPPVPAQNSELSKEI